MAGTRPTVYSCSKKECGRVVTLDSIEVTSWLIARREDNPAKLVIRCPQHITERTLRYAGRRRTKKMYQWAAENKRKDDRARKRMTLPPGGIVPVEVDQIITSVLSTGRVQGHRGYRIKQKKGKT